MKNLNVGVAILSALTWTASACGTSPLAPTSPTGAVPHIVSVTPSLPGEKEGPQRMNVQADGFEVGTILYVTAPDRSADAFTGSTIQHLAVGYEVFMTLSQPGQYVLTARNPGGGLSDPFTLSVEERVKPSVAAITPAALLTSALQQVVSVTGAGFEPGITATLVNGFNGTLIGGDSITGLTSTAFDLHFAFTTPGHYAINFVNLAGDVSNTVSVEVTGAGQDSSGGAIL